MVGRTILRPTRWLLPYLVFPAARPARLEFMPTTTKTTFKTRENSSLPVHLSYTDYMEQWVECFVGMEMSFVCGLWIYLVPYAPPVTNGTHPAHSEIRGQQPGGTSR